MPIVLFGVLWLTQKTPTFANKIWAYWVTVAGYVRNGEGAGEGQRCRTLSTFGFEFGDARTCVCAFCGAVGERKGVMLDVLYTAEGAVASIRQR